MLDRFIHSQPYGSGLFSCDDDVDIITAAQAVICDGEEAIRVGRQIDAYDLGFLVHYMIDEARVLVGEAVMIMAPHMRTEQVVQRCDGPAPRNVIADLQPFRVLIEHRIDEVNERLVAGKKTVASSQQVTLIPALALMLA